MKTLIYGMQSSGASLFTYFMGQNPNAVVVIDLFNKHLAPFLDFEEAILKCVVTNKYSWNQHYESFKPDNTILFVRNPFDNYTSLKRKAWRCENGRMHDKFPILEQEFIERDKFDAVVHYEDLVIRPEQVVEDLAGKGFHVDSSFLEFKRDIQQMAVFNHANCPDYCTNGSRYYQRSKYGKGKLHIRSGPLLKRKYVRKNIEDADKEMVQGWCPTVCNFYGERSW